MEAAGNNEHPAVLCSENLCQGHPLLGGDSIQLLKPSGNWTRTVLRTRGGKATSPNKAQVGQNLSRGSHSQFWAQFSLTEGFTSF